MMQFGECAVTDEISDVVRENDQLRERCARVEDELLKLKERQKCLVHGRVATWACPYCAINLGRERDTKAGND